jgi:hypothetical protein
MFDTAERHTKYGIELYKLRGSDASLARRELARMINAEEGDFPGPNPVSLDTSMFDMLTRQPYWIAEKTDGVRFAVMITKIATATAAATGSRKTDDAVISSSSSGVPVVILFDRTMTPYLCRQERVPDGLYQGTVVDGELATNIVSGISSLLIFDAIVVNGVPVYNMPFSQRLGALDAALYTYQSHVNDPMMMRRKTFVAAASRSPETVHERLRLGAAFWKTDGFVCMPEHGPVIFGRHDALFKIKTCHSVDFHVGEDGTTLYVYDKQTRSLVPVGTSDSSLPPKSIAECVHVKNATWRPLGLRLDKQTGNDLVTYHRTMKNAEEKVTLEDVLRMVGHGPNEQHTAATL